MCSPRACSSRSASSARAGANGRAPSHQPSSRTAAAVPKKRATPQLKRTSASDVGGGADAQRFFRLVGAAAAARSA